MVAQTELIVEARRIDHEEQVKEVFGGIDVAKAADVVAIAECGGSGDVHHFGTIAATPEAVGRLVKKLSKNCDRLHFCYEPRPTRYGV